MKNIHINNFKVFLWILVFSFASKNSWAVTKTWTGTVSTDWTIGSNWGGTAPAPGDDALIPGGLVNYPVINNSVTIRQITINSTGSGAKVTVTTGGSLTATGLITINANGTFILISGTAAIIGITSSGAIDIQGGTITSTGNITVSGTLTQSGGTVWMAVNTSTNPTDNIVISGGTVNQSAGTIYTKDYNPTSGTFNQTGSGAIFRIFRDWKPGSGHTFNSTNGTVQFSGSGGGAPGFSSPNTQFFNVLVDAAVDPSFDNPASIIQIRSNFTNNNSSLNNSTDATFTFNGTGTQTLTSASTGTNKTFGNLIINKSSGSATQASTINTLGNLTVSQGIYDIANFNSSAGVVTLSNGIISGTTGVLTGTSYQVQSGSISAILAGAVPFTKTTTGTVLLSGNNTWSGTTTISAGTLALAASGVIANNSAIILNGGTFSTGITTGWNETLGTLTVNANSSISLGSGLHTLGFAVSTGVAASVTVTGWTGGYNGTSGTAGKIKFGSSASGLTSAQLGRIRFFNGSNYYAATILSDGEVVPSSVFHAPNSLSYSSPNYFTNGIVIIPLSPAITGFIESYGISPALPAGLTFNNTTGIISGTPTAISPLNTYTITASNISGSTTFIVSIAVGSTITTGGSGNWSSTIDKTPWPGGIVPKAWDRVLIKNGHTVTVDISNAACSSIELCAGAGGIARLNFSGTTPSLTVLNNIDVGGPANNNRTGIITFTAGATLSAGSVSLNRNLNGTSYSEINMTAGGTLKTGSLIIGGTGTIALWTPGTGTVQMTATNTLPSTIFTNFNNLQINTGATTTGVAIATLTGSLTVKAGATFLLNHPVGATTAPTSTILEWGLAGSSLTGSGTLTLGGPVNVNYVANGSIDAKIAVPLALGATRTFTVASDGATITTGLTVSSVIGGSACGISKSGAGTMALLGTNTFTGGTTLNAGSLNINNSQALGAVIGTFTINGGLINNTTGGTLTTANYPQAWNGDFTFTGTNSMNLGTGTVTLNANRQVTILANSLTVGGVISSGSYNLTKAGAGTLGFESNAITLNGLSLNAGTLVSTSGNMSLAGTFSNNGIFIHNNGTVNFNGTSIQSIPAVDFYHLISSSTGNRTLASSGSIGIASTFIPGSNLFATTGSTVNFNGNADQTIPSFSFHNLSLSTGGIKSIQPTGQVTVNGTFTNNVGNSGFVLKSDPTGTASLIHNSNNVPATVQRYITGAAEAWHFLSSPLSGQEISGSWLPSGTYGNGTGYDLYLWNEPSNCWTYKLDITSPINWNTVHAGANFTPGRGYLYSVQALNPTKEFIGNLNNGSVSYGLTTGSIDVNLTGFNLVGNPYPSSIDWQSASGWTRSNLVSSGGGYDMWIWNPAAGNYGACNSSSGSGTNGVTRYIAPMQGYFVRAAGVGNLSSDNTARIHNGSGDWKSGELTADRIGLIVQSATDNSFDEVRIQFGFLANQTGTAKLFSPVLTAPSLYIPSGGANFTVQYLTSTTDYPAIPIMLKVGQDGSYSLRGNFDPNNFEIVLLEDRKTKTMQDLKEAPSYTFTASKSDNPNRFILHFSQVSKLSVDQLPAAIFTEGPNVIVDLTFVNSETDVTIYDVIGRKLFQQKLQGGIRHTLTFNAGTRLSIVTLTNPEGSLSRKILSSR